jgi:hypothetical protein
MLSPPLPAPWPPAVCHARRSNMSSTGEERGPRVEMAAERGEGADREGRERRGRTGRGVKFVSFSVDFDV